MANESVVLLNGERRNDYIRRRLLDGLTPADVTREINHPDLYTGPADKKWAASIVYQEKMRMEKEGLSVVPERKSVLEAEFSEEFGREDPLDAFEQEGVQDGVNKTLPSVPAQFEDVLTPEDVAEIEKEAADKVRKTQKKKAKDELLRQATERLELEARRAQQSGAARGDMVDVTIDIAPFADRFRIDGVEYYHGHTYRVGRNLASVLREQMARGWAHQDEISGQKTDFFRQRNIRMSGKTGAVVGAEGLRV